MGACGGKGINKRHDLPARIDRLGFQARFCYYDLKDIWDMLFSLTQGWERPGVIFCRKKDDLEPVSKSRALGLLALQQLTLHILYLLFYSSIGICYPNQRFGVGNVHEMML